MVSQEGWGDLATKLNEWLKGFAEQHGLTHRNQHQAIPGFPHNGFKSDGLVTDGRRIIAVEIEYGQTHPDTNVGKYWLLFEKRRYEKLVLIHVFLHNGRPHRRELAKFYIEKMKNSSVPIEYIVLDDRNICYENIDDVLSKIKSKIRERYKNIFGQSTRPSLGKGVYHLSTTLRLLTLTLRPSATLKFTLLLRKLRTSRNTPKSTYLKSSPPSFACCKRMHFRNYCKYRKRNFLHRNSFHSDESKERNRISNTRNNANSRLESSYSAH